MSLKRVPYTDSDGRKKLVLLPEEAPESEAELGVPIGPPDLSELGLPQEIEIRLNNELFYRHILTSQEAQRNRMEIINALIAVLKVDANKIVTLYLGGDHKYAEVEARARENNTVPVRRSRRRR